MLAQKTPYKQMQYEDGIRREFHNQVMQDIEKLDTKFSLQNFQYVMSQMNNDDIKNVYQKLGPFNFQKYDHYQFPSFFDDDEKADE